MNAFSPIETEHRLAQMFRQSVEAARSSSRLARLREHAGRAPFLFYITAVATAAAFYYFLLAAPLYTAEAKFAVRGRQPMAASPLLAALSGGAQDGAADTPLLKTYLESQSALDSLDRNVRLRQEYSTFRPDFFHRLRPRAPQRIFLKFYNELVRIDLDNTTGTLSLHVNGFSAASASATAAAVLKLSETFINNLSRQSQDEATRSARRDLATAQQADTQARAALTGFQSHSGSLDPGAYGTATGTAMFAVQASIGQMRAQLASMMTYSTANAPQVRQLQAQIANLQQQEAQLNQKLVGQSSRSAIVNQLGGFQSLVQKETYAAQRVTALQAQLDLAVSTAAQKQEFVVLISGPTRPDSATPRALWGVATSIVIAAFIYACIRLAIASIRDHQM